MSVDDVQRFRSRVGQLEHDLAEAKKNLDAALITSSEFSPGDECEAWIDQKWVEAVVLRAIPHWGKLEYAVGLRKKDGSWSKRERRIYSFSKGLRAKGSA